MAENILKKIPYGISDYKTIVEKNYIFVDKTRYIELFENQGEPYIFFLRPRRFGKSLFTSILEYYYDISAEKEFDKLFCNTYIGKNPTQEHNSYYVLKFNFSGINTFTRNNLIEGFVEKALTGFSKFEEKYNIEVDYKKDGMPSDIFEQFLRNVTKKIDGKILVLIDEYDHFANELLSFQVDVFEETVSTTGFVRKWYEVLKSGTDNGLIQRIFATGVSPITLDSLTSGFNIAKNKTRDIRFNECLGFTQDEVKEILKQSLGDAIDVGREMPVLKRYYNGYMFARDAENRIFNSDMVLYYASEYIARNAPPEQLIDTNVSSDYKKIASLFTIKNKEQNFQVLKDIIEGMPQRTLITPEFSMAKDFSKDDFKSLLFFLGFLTIDKAKLSSVDLIVPNYVIKELYFDFFGSILKQEAHYNIDVSDIRESIEDIALNAEIRSFMEIVTTTLKKLSNRDFIQFNEKYVKIIMLTYFMMSRVYYVKSEYEVDEGYIDIALLPKPGVCAPYYAIFEVKYIKKSEFTSELLEEKVKASKTQISKYIAVPELREMDSTNNLLKWVLVFCGDELVYEEKV